MKEIIKKEDKSIKLLEDYFSILTLFKSGGTKKYNISDITKKELLSFLNKFYLYENEDFKSCDKNKKLEFIEYFELKENETNLYNTVICLIGKLLTIIKLKEEKKGFKNTKLNFNGKTFDIQFVKKYHTYILLLIIDTLYFLQIKKNVWEIYQFQIINFGLAI